MTEVTVDIRDEQVPAALALPAGGSGPAVIVIQEWWGLVPHIHDVVQRFADEGFVALAIDHYRGVRTTEPDEAQKLMLGLSVEQVAIDLDVAAAELLSRDEVVGGQVAVVGFCMGGGLALLAPTVSEAITKAVAFYPAMPWPHFAPDWTQYRDKSALVHLAEHDDPGTATAVAQIAQQIDDAGGDVIVVDYPGGVHAFYNDSRPEVFQPENATLAWARTIDFLRG